MAEVADKPRKATRKPAKLNTTERPKLNQRQLAFCDGIMLGKNATQAYRDAGYNSEGHAAEASAWTLLRRPEVIAELDRRRYGIAKRIDVTAERVVEELARLGFADAAALAGVRCAEDIPSLSPAARAAIAGWEYTEHGFRLKLWPKVQALELLAKKLRLLDSGAPAPTGSQVYVVVVPPAAATPEQWAQDVRVQAEAPKA